ncbi:MAG: ferritin family protein [Nitrososphaerales archaeon]
MKDELSKKIEELILMEEMQSQQLSVGVKTLGSVMVKEILNGVALDSKEHAGFYRAIKTLLTEESSPLIEDEYMKMENIIRTHIQVEDRMKRAAAELLAKVEDSRVKHLLKEILQDEIRHHKLMQNLLESIVKRTIMEEDVWDMIWKDVPGHGAPIG